MSVAVCYFGLLRSLKKTYNTHINYIFNELTKNNIDYDIFLHTWKTKDNSQYVWDKIINVKQDYIIPNELKTKMVTSQFDIQDDYLNTIDFSKYFYEEEYKKYGEKKEWRPQLIKNHLCALESIKRVVKLVKNSKKKYKYIMILRPDSKINNYFPIQKCLQFLNIKDNGICIPKYLSYEGYNDRFAFMNIEHCNYYCNRLDEIIDFRKNNGRIVSEKYNKYIVDKYYSLLLIDFKFDTIRP